MRTFLSMQALLMFVLVSVLLPFRAASAHAPVKNLQPTKVQELWQAENSEVEAVERDGQTVYRWRLRPGQTGTLAVRADHPLLGRLRYYDYLTFEMRVASGSVGGANLRMLGHVSGPRQYKIHNWLVAARTTEREVWHRRCYELARPNWFPWDDPDGTGGRAFVRLTALGLEPGTVVELRGMTLTHGAIRLKPDFLAPITWPVFVRDEDGGALGSFRHHAVNASGRPTDIVAEVVSRHRRFAVSVAAGADVPKPGSRRAVAAGIKHGRRAVFTVTAGITKADMAAVPELYAEPVVLAFYPVHMPEARIVWRGELVRPLSPSVRRQVILKPADLAAVRKALKGGDEQLKKLLRPEIAIRGAEEFLKKDLLRIPTGHAHVSNNWIGSWRVADRMPEIVDTKTGEKQFDTAIAAQTWKEYLSHRGNALNNLAYAYLYTGEGRYARKAVELFDLYAQQYLDLSWRNLFDPPWAKGPAILCSTRTAASSTYGSNWYFKGHCLLLSAIADSEAWTEESRGRVYERFILPYATELMKFHGGISNMTDITNRNLLLIGLAFRDAGILRHALLSDAGLIRRLDDITPDGFSSEGRPLNYHFAAMSEYLPALSFLDNANIEAAYPRERLLAAIRMPFQRGALNRLVPNTGDCGRGWRVSARGEADWLVGMFPDEKWLRDAGRMSALPARLLAWRTGGEEKWGRFERLLETGPRLFEDAGFAILRTGERVEEQIMVTFDYGRNPMHAHLDRNQITLIAFGHIFTQGPGTLYNVGRGGMERVRDRRLESFCGHGSLGQNVVLVDRRDQFPAVGRRLAWRADGEMQMAAAKVPAVRPGVDHTRAVVLAGGIVVIFDKMESAEEHTYDFVYHNLGQLKLPEGWRTEALTEPLGKTANYENIVDPRRLRGKGPVNLIWQVADKANLSLWQLPVAGGEFYTGVTGMNNHERMIIPDRAPSLIQRVEGKTVHFVTVLEPWREKPRVQRVEAIGADGVRVHLADEEPLTLRLGKLLEQGK